MDQRSEIEADLNRLAAGDLPDIDPALKSMMKSLPDSDPDVAAGMDKLRSLREQEVTIRELPARDQS